MAKFNQIKELLNKENIEYKVIDLPDTAISVDDVVRLSNGQVKEEEIIKTLIGRMKSGEFKVLILRGRDRLNTQKVEGFDRLATKEEVFQVTDVEPGAVCPILLSIPVIIDQKVMNLEKVNMGSGDHLKGLEMDLSDLMRVLPDNKTTEISL